MKPSFASILRCPECKGELSLQNVNGSPANIAGPHAEIDEGSLACSDGHEFPIVRGIPRFVSDEQYAGSFGFEWNLFNLTQLDSAAESGDPDDDGSDKEDLVNYAGFIARKGKESYDTFYHKTGLSPEELKGKRILDAGCGTGRFAEIAADAGAEVVGCDLSLAVEACYKNLGSRSNVHVAQGDIFKLPLAEGAFDLIYSLGVLHHTPDTRGALLSLPRLLKEGGKLCTWVYEKLPNRWGIIPPWYFMSDIYRSWTSRWPSERLLSFSKIRARLHPLIRIPLAGKVFERIWPGSVHPEYEWRVLDTFDWYSPAFQWKHNWEEMESWFQEAGLKEIKQLPFPVSGSAVKTSRV